MFESSDGSGTSNCEGTLKITDGDVLKIGGWIAEAAIVYVVVAVCRVCWFELRTRTLSSTLGGEQSATDTAVATPFGSFRRRDHKRTASERSQAVANFIHSVMSGVDINTEFSRLGLNRNAQAFYDEMIDDLLTVRPENLPQSSNLLLPRVRSSSPYPARYETLMPRNTGVMPTPMPPPMPMRQITDTDSAAERAERAERGSARAKQREAALVPNTFFDAKCSAEREAMCTFLDTCEDLPDQFRCPLSLVALRDPVCCSDGHVYEREYIQRHILTAWKSPLTRKELLDNVYPVLAITQLMESWAKQKGYSAHPEAVLV